MLRTNGPGRTCTFLTLSFILPLILTGSALAQSEMQDGSVTIGTSFDFSAGRLQRGGSGFLRTESGGAIINPMLVYQSNDDDFGSFSSDTVVEYPTLPVFRPIHGPREQLIFGASKSWSSIRSSHSIISADGNALGILSPLANGPLGGGVRVLPGFGNVSGAEYTSEFDHTEYHLGSRHKYQAGDVEIKPSLWLQYGHIDIQETFSGRTNGNTLDFAYDNDTKSGFFGFGAGVDLEVPIGNLAGIPVEFYGGAWVMPQFHDFGGYSKLTVAGFAPEIKNLGGSEQSVAYQAYGSLSFRLTANIKLDVGARYRRFESPVLHITGNKDAEIHLEDARQLGGYASLYARYPF